MDTYYDVENTNTGGMIVNVTEKKGDDTKTFVKKFTRFTEGFDYINKSRFHEAFDALNNLGWLYAHRGKDISIEMFSPCGENLFVFVPNVTFDYTKIEAIEIIKRDSRRYAKRQLTWFKRYQDAKWFDLDKYQDIEILKEDIINHIEKLLEIV